MSNSSLGTVKILSPNKTSPRNHVIDSVAIHCMAGNLTAEACGNWFAKSSTQASSNYGIGSDGTIGLYVDESDRSWCTSSPGVDHRAVTIEVSNMTSASPYRITNEAYDALISLLADICVRNGIESLKWKDDKDYAISAANGGPVTEQNMFVHMWFANKDCPGEYLYSQMGNIANYVNAKIGGGQYNVTTSTIYNSGISRDAINYSDFNPYIITIMRDSKPEYSKLDEANVFAGLIEAGYHFDGQHKVMDKFDNQNLEDQVSSLDELELPYGLFTYGRAKNQNEAKDEMYKFSFPLRRHPPKLGAWIQMSFDNGEEINNLVVERYKQDLVRLGFAGKMGLICTRDQLEKFDWESYQEDFFLWLIDHVDDLSELDVLLDPEFFDTDGEG